MLSPVLQMPLFFLRPESAESSSEESADDEDEEEEEVENEGAPG